MKICFIGYDHSVDIAQRLINDGHEIIQLFTFPCDNEYAFNVQMYNLAEHYKIPISKTAITPEHIDALVDSGCKLFLCAGYPSKIPPIPEDKAYAVNIHPTYLPVGRGVMPLPFIITEAPEAAGFTIHKMTEKFDAGDILYQQKINIDERTDILTLSARIGLACPDAASMVVADIKQYWDSAVPQNHDKAVSFPMPSTEFRTLHWDVTTDEINMKSRAFGRFGVIASVSNTFGQTQKMAVYQLSTWKEEHGHKPGHLMRSSPLEIVIAVKDGYTCLQSFKLLN